MTARRAPAWLVATVLTLAVGLTVTVTPARAQDACEGVRVVVDATTLGGGLTARCLAGDPATGLEALRDAGHTYTFVPRQPGLVCTIDARPEPCNGAPEDAYWSYWHAPAGGSWTYSTRGAGNRDPEPGTVEGWAFGAGDPPREPPPPTDEPEPRPADEAAAGPEPTAPADGDGAEEDTGDDRSVSGEGDTTAPPVAASPGPAANGSPRATAPAAVPSPDPGQEPSPTELDDPPGPVEPASASPTPSPLAGDVVASGGGGAPVGLLAGGLLIAGLAGAGVLQARRRDRA